MLVKFGNTAAKHRHSFANNFFNQDFDKIFKGFEKGSYTIELFGTDGKLIDFYSVKLTQEDQLTRFDLPLNIEKGVYFLCVKSYFSPTKTIRFVISN